jgi:hypothetical protein
MLGESLQDLPVNLLRLGKATGLLVLDGQSDGLINVHEVHKEFTGLSADVREAVRIS